MHFIFTRLSALRPTMLSVMLILFTASGAYAAGTSTWSGTGNWTTAGNWSGTGSAPPAAGDAVVINSGTCTINTTTTVASLQINSGATLKFNKNTNRTLTVSGSVNVDGTFD